MLAWKAILPPIFLAAAVSFLANWQLSRLKTLGRGMDSPNERSLHSHPIPRLGGVGVMFGILGATILLNLPFAQQTLLALVAVAAMSLLDDLHPLPALWRLAGHLATASAVVALESNVPLPWTLGLAAVFGIAWMMNLYNFMDGANGLAGGMSSFGFAWLALAAAENGQTELAIFCLVIVAASSAFLVFNFDPASIFMGDVGSISLGFLAGTLGFVGWQKNVWPIWFPLIAFAPFVFDASLTLISRALKGERIWQAHREHLYQRLIRSGWSHRQTALAEYAWMFASGFIGWQMIHWPLSAQMLGCAFVALTHIAAALLINRRWKNREQTTAGQT